MGLYTQQDPIGIAGGLNTYGYANGDPINFSDPFGLTPCGPFTALCARVAAFVLGRVGPAIARVGPAIAAAFQPGAEPNAGDMVGGATRVIGRLGEYEDFAESAGHAFFRLSDEVWESLDDAGRWARNQEFLDAGIANGDEFLIRSSDYIPSGSFLDREIRYLRENGYLWSEDGARLIPGGGE